MEKLIDTSDSGEPLIFKCQNAWKNLKTHNPIDTVRYCEGCHDSVFLYDTFDDAKQHAQTRQLITLRDEIPSAELMQYNNEEICTWDYMCVDPVLNLTVECENGEIHRFYDTNIAQVIGLYQLAPLNSEWHTGFVQESRFNDYLAYLEQQYSCYNRPLIHKLKSIRLLIKKAVEKQLKWQLIAHDHTAKLINERFFQAYLPFGENPQPLIEPLNDLMTIDKLTDIACLSGNQQHFNLILNLTQQKTPLLDLLQQDIELLKSLLIQIVTNTQDPINIAFVASLLLRLRIKDSYSVNSPLENLAAMHFVSSIMQLNSSQQKAAITFLSWRIQQRTYGSGRGFLVSCAALILHNLKDESLSSYEVRKWICRETVMYPPIFLRLSTEIFHKKAWGWLRQHLDTLAEEWLPHYLCEFLEQIDNQEFAPCHMRVC